MNIRLAVVSSLAAAFSVVAVKNSRPDESVKVEKPAADPMLGKKLGQICDDNGLKMKLVWCPTSGTPSMAFVLPSVPFTSFQSVEIRICVA
jgi:hypothetical protein